MKSKGVESNLSIKLVKKVICYLLIGKGAQYLYISKQLSQQKKKVNDMVYTKTK